MPLTPATSFPFCSIGEQAGVQIVARALEESVRWIAGNAGVEGEIVGHRKPWLRVRLVDGLDSWMQESSLTPVVEGPR